MTAVLTGCAVVGEGSRAVRPTQATLDSQVGSEREKKSVSGRGNNIVKDRLIDRRYIHTYIHRCRNIQET
jgi:hypothetical protein